MSEIIIHKLIRVHDDKLICYDCGLVMSFTSLEIILQGDQADQNIHHTYFETTLDSDQVVAVKDFTKPAL